MTQGENVHPCSRKKTKKGKKKREKRRKIPIKKSEESKIKKIPNQGSKENRRNIQKILWTRQYLNNTKLSPSQQEKKGNHDLKWSSPFDYQPKSRASVTCSPCAKQKQKRKRPKKNTQSQIFHQEETHSQEKVLLIHDHACNLWFDRKWFAKSSHDIPLVRI